MLLVNRENGISQQTKKHKNQIIIFYQCSGIDSGAWIYLGDKIYIQGAPENVKIKRGDDFKAPCMSMVSFFWDVFKKVVEKVYV